MCSNCHVWPKLLLALRLSPQYSVDVRANKKQEKQTSKKTKTRLWSTGGFCSLCITVTTCLAFINRFMCVPVIYSMLSHLSPPYPPSCHKLLFDCLKELSCQLSLNNIIVTCIQNISVHPIIAPQTTATEFVGNDSSSNYRVIGFKVCFVFLHFYIVKIEKPTAH